TGFRVQVTYLPGPITPATANQLRWQVNWRATPLRHTYTFAGQHIAQRQGKTRFTGRRAT
ncbi:MAG: hypothetical protein NT075_10640, partial [Chloroflexi bacterium]|nr:hypothetical protein [Chloroflexota bacterium]